MVAGVFRRSLAGVFFHRHMAVIRATMSGGATTGGGLSAAAAAAPAAAARMSAGLMPILLPRRSR